MLAVLEWFNKPFKAQLALAGKRVEKAKASSVAVDLRERFLDAVLSTLLVTMAIGHRFCLFRRFWTCQRLCRLVGRQTARPKQEYVSAP